MPLEMARVILFAKDMKRMTSFYESVVGLQRFDGLHLCDGIDPEGNVFQISNR